MAKSTARNGIGAIPYAKLNRSDLRAFDTKAWEIVRDAQEYGWTFRVSSRGHAIGRSPDGKTTMSVANRYDSKRTGANARAEFERWKKSHQTEAAQTKKVTGAVTSIIANLSRDLIASYTDKSPDDVPETLKVMLKRMADQDDVAAYMADRIAMGRPAPIILTHDLDSGGTEITEKSKPWRIQWVMADPDTNKVIGWGGPKMSAAEAENAVLVAQAADARAKAEAKQAAIDAATPTPKPTRPIDTTKMETFMKMYPCPEPGCDAVFEKPASLGTHKFSKHQPKATCKWCGGEFTRGAMNTHEPSCTSNPHRDDTYECGRCEGVFKITGRGRHEGVCKKLNPEQLAEKRAKNRRERGLELPNTAATPAAAAAAMPTTGQVRAVDTEGAPAWVNPPVAETHLSRLAASLPQIADPLSALMNLLAEVEELRAARPAELQAQIVALTEERDTAIKRAEEAEGKLATLKSVFG